MQTTEAHIAEILLHDESVRGLVLTGSRARPEIVPDEWSDLDLVLIVNDESLGVYVATTDWAMQFGDIYAFEQSSGEHFSVLRAQYTDALCIDFVIIPESSLESIDQWAQNPLRFANRCLFSRSSLLDQVLNRTYPERVPEQPSSKQFEQMANGFWFKGMLAANKAARNELLVAAHLALDMARDCLVLAMMIRNRATGTDHHRDGSKGNHLLEVLDPPLGEYTPSGVLDSVERSAVVFESLAVQLDSSYRDHREPLLGHIAEVRKALLRDA